MQIVINISHNLYESIVKDYALSKLGEHELYKAVQKGNPLPKHYGKLGDIDVLEEKILHIMEGDKRTFNNQITDDGLYYDGVYAVLKILKQAPTIIPATEEKSCKNCKYGKAYEHGADITTMDDECGGCCSWNDKWTPKQTATKEGDGE